MKQLIPIFFSCLLFPVAPVFSHGGGLNKDGCHKNRKTETYHCHRGSKSSSSGTAEPKKDIIFGIARVTDGDSIRIGATRIRLYGIDAPELQQTCNAGGEVWNCGQEAKKNLEKLIGSNLITCSVKEIDRYRRLVAVCRAGSTHLNAWIVENGWAVAYRFYSKAYIKDEHKAKAGRKGIWRGTFAMPWDWRKTK